MAKTRTVQKYTDQAIERANTMSKAEYQRIKHMNKIELVHYLGQLCDTAYKQGYEKCQKAMQAAADRAATPTDSK